MLSESTEYVHIPITGPSAASLTVDNIEISFSATRAEPDEWHPANLYEDQTAKILVGPEGGVLLTEGVWYVFGRITDTPEVPVLYAGELRIR